MTTDLDTLLTALYVRIDDEVLPLYRCHRCGRRPPRLSDAELCLAPAARGPEYMKHRARACLNQWWASAPACSGGIHNLSVAVAAVAATIY